MKRIETPALLVRSVGFGESDVIATFFTAEAGKLSAVVRGARRSHKRFGGALEPIHELVVTLEDKGKELLLLKEARLGRPREGIVRSLDAMDAAGRALRWVRHLCPARTPEPAIWSSLRALFDVLDALGHGASAESGLSPVIDQHLAVFGFGLLAAVGYAIDLTCCARCGKPCPEGRPAFVDPAGGRARVHDLWRSAAHAERRGTATGPAGASGAGSRLVRDDAGVRPRARRHRGRSNERARGFRSEWVVLTASTANPKFMRGSVEAPG